MPFRHPTRFPLRAARRFAALSLAAAMPAAGGDLAEAPSSKAAPDPAAASKTLDDMSLEELAQLKVGKVYGASRREQDAAQAPADVTLVTADDIKLNGYRTLADILQSVRGFYITSDRIYTYIGARGLNRPGDFGGRVLITVNGHRVNDPIADQSFNGDEFPVDVDLIDHVEVIRGPGSSLYGNNAFFTVVNVVTRQGRDVGGSEVSGSAASYGTYSGRATYGTQFKNGVELLLSGTWRSSEGQGTVVVPEYAAVNGGRADQRDGSRSPNGWISLKWSDLTLEGSYVDRRKDVPLPQGGVFFNTRPAWQEDEREFAGLRFEHGSSEDWRIVSSLYFDRYITTLRGTYDPSGFGLPGTSVVNQDSGLAEWIEGSFQVDKTLWERQVLTVGGDYRNNFNIEQKSATFTTPSLLFQQSTNTQSYGFFAQDEITLVKGLLLNTGVRYDYYDTFGATVDPRAGLIYDTSGGGAFKFLFGDAFRAPNIYERYYNFPGYAGNPALHPERVRSYELVAEQALDEHIRILGNLFFNDIDSLITQVYDPIQAAYVFSNTDQVSARGFEWEARGQWSRGFQARLSYTFTDADQRSAGGAATRLLNSPRHLVKAGVTVPVWAEKVFATAEVEGIGERLSAAGGLPAYAVVNLTLFARRLAPGLDLSVSAYNLFDDRHRDPVGPDLAPALVAPQLGRQLRAKLTFAF